MGRSLLRAIFIWASLPEGLQATDVAKFALDEGMFLAPGNVFSLSKAENAFLRFNVAQCGDPKTFAILSNAMDRAMKSYPGYRIGNS